ncbi:hypothetical protein GCM10023238_18640 [Streptomyces heliomycini]
MGQETAANLPENLRELLLQRIAVVLTAEETGQIWNVTRRRPVASTRALSRCCPAESSNRRRRVRPFGT